MVYEENVTQKITYSFEDLMIWARIFAGKQFGVNPEEIKPEHISLVGMTEQVIVCVTHTKVTSNQKEEKETIK